MCCVGGVRVENAIKNVYSFLYFIRRHTINYVYCVNYVRPQK